MAPNRSVTRAMSVCRVSAIAVLSVAILSFPASATKTPAPKITQFAASPAFVSAAGASVAISALVSGGTGSCTLVSNATIAGLPAHFACGTGLVTRRVTIATNAGTLRNITFSLTVHSPTTSKTVTLAVPQGTNVQALTWAHAALDPFRGDPLSLSCASSNFCMAGDSNANIFSFNGSHWSGPTKIVDDPTANTRISSLSCVSSTWCVAVIGEQVFVYDGSWEAPRNVFGLSAIQSVSCASQNFCVATGSSNYVVFNGSGWTAPQTFGGSTFATMVSCPVDNYCVGLNSLGQFTVFDGIRWSTASSIGDTSATALSCASVNFCGALGFNGDVTFFDGTSWATPINVDPGNTLTTMSCPTNGTCVASDGVGHVLSYASQTWSSPVVADSVAFIALSCGSSISVCSAIDPSGNLLNLAAGDWTSSPLDTPMGPLVSTSCASASFCAAVDGTGYAFIFDGSTWSGPTNIDAQSSLTAVSCGLPNFCVAVDSRGGATTYQNGAWGSVLDVDAKQSINNISCTAGPYCVGTDWGNATVVNNNGTWHVVAGGGSSVVTISCVSHTFCMGSNGSQYAVFNGSTWGAFAPITTSINGFNVNQLDCTSSTWCAAAGQFERNAVSFTYNGHSWSDGTQVLAPQGSTLNFDYVSCPETNLCHAYAPVGGLEYTFDGLVWSHLDDVGPFAGLSSLSCPTMNFCLGINRFGDAYYGT